MSLQIHVKWLLLVLFGFYSWERCDILGNKLCILKFIGSSVPFGKLISLWRKLGKASSLAFENWKEKWSLGPRPRPPTSSDLKDAAPLPRPLRYGGDQAGRRWILGFESNPYLSINLGQIPLGMWIFCRVLSKKKWYVDMIMLRHIIIRNL